MVYFLKVMAAEQDTGGYDYQFVNPPPDRLVCLICHFPCHNSHLSVCCGHNYCKSCLEIVKTAGYTRACPVCYDSQFQTFPNRQADREVKSLHVFCVNKKMGCEWQGELNDIKNHLGNSDGCQFEYVKCSNKCGKVFQWQYLSNHVEAECPQCKLYCPYCNCLGEYHFVVGKHVKSCLRLLFLFLTTFPFDLFVQKTWKHTGKNVLSRWSSVSFIQSDATSLYHGRT